ncbi:protein THEM6 [Leguminivora glycinivorella]|uniref:protein THEM6 n=1 Tax=Leguminivora glycinivorella TaxID=1035111 RepID=UPI00201029B5|nr:protein THEM6 [Leguminivora glycinivorella]
MWPLCIPAWGAAVAAGAFVLYGTIDVAYFARMLFTVTRARYFRKKACLLETTEVGSWVLLSDIDTLLYHMNNARYLRELDFARADFYERTGLYSNIKAAGGSVVQAACTIRYRRYLKPFTKFTITSRVIYWDNKTVFMEHEFVGPGRFVHAVAVCRQRVIDTAVAPIAELLVQLHCAGTCKPQLGKMPPELELWVQSNELSSARLRSNLVPAPFLPASPQIGSGESITAAE